jgi:ADP-ribose pyrophosphatase YjhB (NUDIX family)
MMIKKWFDFDPFENLMKKSAGVIIILNNNKVLLCHPTNSRWFGTYSFPKGGLEKGETSIDAAIRELREESSIVIDMSKITNPNSPIIVDYVNKKGEKKYKQLYLYTVYINDVSEIGLDSETISTERLQIEEIDWCGFLPKQEAKSRIFHRVSHLLDMIN